MSTEMNPITSEVQSDVFLTSFYGGRERGRCLQVDQVAHGGRQVVVLTKEQAVTMIHRLCEFISTDEKVNSQDDLIPTLTFDKLPPNCS